MGRSVQTGEKMCRELEDDTKTRGLTVSTKETKVKSCH